MMDKVTSVKQALSHPCREFTNHRVPHLLILEIVTQTRNLTAH